jgi:hypothetical protein
MLVHVTRERRPLGVSIREMPLSPNRIRELIERVDRSTT